jgi:hypothetical protein
MADEKDQPRPNQLNIEISEEVADGIYSNLAIITHSNSEFVLDFVRVMPGVPKAKVRARVLLTPQHAKRLMRALADNIQKFEAGPRPHPRNGNARDPHEFRWAYRAGLIAHVERKPSRSEGFSRSPKLSSRLFTTATPSRSDALVRTNLLQAASTWRS